MFRSQSMEMPQIAIKRCRSLFIASNPHLRMALQVVCSYVLTQTRRVLEISVGVTKPDFGSHAPGERAVYQSLALFSQFFTRFHDPPKNTAMQHPSSRQIPDPINTYPSISFSSRIRCPCHLQQLLHVAFKHGCSYVISFCHFPFLCLFGPP